MGSNNGDNVMSADEMIEILLRLPVKSLLRFRCVNKYWYTTIAKSSFTVKHHNHHRNKAHLLVQHYNYTIEKFTYAFFPDENLTTVPPSYHDIDDVSIPVLPLIVIGPVHGILCLYNSWDLIALWNPALREFRPLPAPENKYPPHFNACWHGFGLGFDPLTSNYKVVWIRFFWDDSIDTLYQPRVVAVYTLATDSWRVFEIELPLDHSVDNTLTNSYLNGSYYWVTSGNSRDYMILKFDMNTENFHQIQVPPDFPKLPWADLTLYNESLAMIVYDPPKVEKFFEIWVMKEESFWTKHLIVGPFQEVKKPLGFWKTGELFLLNSSTSQLVLYNIDTQEMKELGPRAKDHCLKVFIYKHSLVSVKGQNKWPEGYSLSKTIQNFYTRPPDRHGDVLSS